MAKQKMYDIFEAAQELGLSEAYIRMQIRHKVIKSVPTPVSEGSRVTKHMIPVSELKLFASRDYARAPRRDDGRAKCCFYATPDEVNRIKELLYLSEDPGLKVVAQSIITNKGVPDEHYVPPSKTQPS